MKQKIYSITEAFSMQPVTLRLGSQVNSTRLHRIELEIINIPVNGDPYDYQYYVGYDIDDNRLFEYRRETVNVHFE